MAEGGFEVDELGMDGAAFDDDLGDPADGAEEEFMDGLENTYEARSTTPRWAGGEEMPDGLSEGDLASNDYQDSAVAKFMAERSKYARQARLKFIASKTGHLWVRWGRFWKLLTWKNDPNKFLSRLSIEIYRIDLARALGV